MSTINRRHFLQTTAAVSSVSLFNILHAADKAGTQRPVIGEGAHRYEVYHDWLTPPEGLLWGDTHGVAQDKAGRIYIAHTVNSASVKKDTIVVYDAEGKFITSWGAEMAGGAHGLDLREEDGTEFLYHCDVSRKEFSKTTLEGKLVWKKGYPKEAEPYAGAVPIKWNCTNVAFHPGGDLFVADGYGSGYILRYSKDGEFKGQVIGTPGKGDGQFANTHGLWVDTRHETPKLVVADRGNSRLQIFSIEGKHERTVTAPGYVRKPCHFHVRGDLMVCPDLAAQVILLDKDYKMIARLGDGQGAPGGPKRGDTRDKFLPGKFLTPHDAMILANGDILVTEWIPIGRVTLLKKVA
jgi:hypothetical protein